MTTCRLCEVPCAWVQPEEEADESKEEVDPNSVEAQECANDGEASKFEDEVSQVDREHRPDSDDPMSKRLWIIVVIGEEVSYAALAHHQDGHGDAEQLGKRWLSVASLYQQQYQEPLGA